MPEISFGRLTDLPLRDAWQHEARHFTPWLAQNIEHLSDAIGMPLEIDRTEVAVESFAADILARNPEDGSVVLIENQLERTDHSHLGQIMTYLAGLEAQTVIWIAPEFRGPHLTAIKWLNEHTADGFSFFAVKLRVVRIGDSPFAPIFEVVAKPDDFERELKSKVVSEGAAYYDIKEEFWTDFLERTPRWNGTSIKPYRFSTNYFRVFEEPAVEAAIWIGRETCGIYLRPVWGGEIGPVADFLGKHTDRLSTVLEAEFGLQSRRKHLFSKRLQLGHDRRENWPEMIRWLDVELIRYQRALADLET